MTEVTDRYACSCCGYLTLNDRPPGTYQVCPICFWQDATEDWGLYQAQLNFARFGASDEQWLAQVRAPSQAERRPEGWKTLQQLEEAARPPVIEAIQKAFAHVRREEGITLHEAMAIDGYEMEENRQQARSLDTDTRWQDIPEKDIEESPEIFSYLDPKGFRYHLPAYMIWSLEHLGTSSSSSHASAIYALGRAKDDYRQRDLNKAQAVAVYQFLRFMVDHRYYADDAQQALDDYWAQFAPQNE